LPQDGKLLPLLQQTLDSVAAAGGDLKQFMERLVAKLDRLTEAGVPVPEQQLAVALQQVLQEMPALSAALPPDTLATIARAAGAPTGAVASTPAPVIAAAATSGPRAPDLQAPGQPTPVHRDSGATTFDTTMSQLSAPVTARDQPPPDMSALLTAFKRMTGDNRPTTSDAPLHPAMSLSGPSASATGPAPAAVSPGMPMVTVTTAFGQPGWDQALGERIQWLAGQKMQSAQVKLNPANLGPMEIRIQIQNDQASIQFTSHHAVVREALEAAMPRLRDMLEASGVALVNVDVSGQGPSTGHQQAMPGGDNAYPGGGFDADATGGEAVVQTPLVTFYPQGRLDLFA
jgi:flagellar hook-length control protein FliK